MTAPVPVFSVCVYCGSRSGASPAYAQAAAAVGRLIGQQGWRLVYGGGDVGLMGIVADAALSAGAPVVGVIPQSLVDREVGHQRLSEQHVVPDMHVRKRMMAERADAFVALPGGIGTLEELFEVWTWHQLGYHRKPVGLLNVAGYYDSLLAFLQHSVAQGFLGPEQLPVVDVHTQPAALLQALHRRARGTPAGDFSQI
jgi:hypothetical protein